MVELLPFGTTSALTSGRADLDPVKTGRWREPRRAGRHSRAGDSAGRVHRTGDRAQRQRDGS